MVVEKFNAILININKKSIVTFLQDVLKDIVTVAYQHWIYLKNQNNIDWTLIYDVDVDVETMLQYRHYFYKKIVIKIWFMTDSPMNNL